jgi:hypothetical protein
MVFKEDMMFGKSRLVLFLVLALVLLLTACAGPFGQSPVTETISNATVSVPMNFVEARRVGPVYDVSVTVPGDWVNQFTVRNEGNIIQFNYKDSSGLERFVFSIEALSDRQYWQQSGSYPGSQVNIVNLGDTYFVYHLPIDTFYSGLGAEEFQAFAAVVPEIVASFVAAAQ